MSNLTIAQTVVKTQELIDQTLIHEIYDSEYGEMMVYVFEDESIVEKVVVDDDKGGKWFFQLGSGRTFDSRNKLELTYRQSDYLEWEEDWQQEYIDQEYIDDEDFY